MSDRTSVGQSVAALRVSPEFDAYSKVVIHLGEDDDGNDVTYQAGDDSGRTLEITNPWGTQEMADNLLQQLLRRGLLYQPYTAERALVDPSAELGDGISIADLYSGIYSQDLTFNGLLASDISAPADEEIDHEFPFVSQEQRQYKRETARLSSRISITATQIEAEVARASAAEGTLSSRITQTASQISIEVSRATAAEGTLSSRITQNANSIAAKVSASGGSSSSFGWELTSSMWRLFSGGTTVLTADRNGLTVNGTINSRMGNIGGFTIGQNAIYNNLSSFGGTQSTGVYLGTNGIQLGQGFRVTSAGAVTASNLAITGGSISIGDNFRVDSSGNVQANNMTLSGTLRVGGSTITADALRSGAQSAYNNSSYWSGGASGGYGFSNAIKETGGTYPSFFRATAMQADRMNVYRLTGVEYITFRGYTAYVTTIDGKRVLALL